MTINLRDYQEQALAAEATHRTEHPDETRLTIVVATGLGKTIVMAERARRHLQERMLWRKPELRRQVLILVHTDELAQQAETKVKLVAGQWWSVGVVKAERDETDADIIIGSVQTLASPARRQRITDVGLVIVDECHHAVASTYQDILYHYGCMPHIVSDDFGGDWTAEGDEPTPTLGLTATLERGDGASLGGVWQNVVFTRDTSWAVRHGYLVQPIGHRIEIDGLDLRPGGLNGGDFSRVASDAALAEGIAPERVVEQWIEHAVRPLMCSECQTAWYEIDALPSWCDDPDCVSRTGAYPSTVLFAPLVRSAEAFCHAFRRAGISSEVIHGAMPGQLRRAALDYYEAGTLPVICNAMVLTEGWDSPRTQCVIVARPTKSRALFVQMAGRGLRPDPLKPVEEQSCLLLVVADATTDMCTVADLSDKPLDRRAEGALTAMEDQWDIGKELDEAEREKLWTGRVSAKEFDPLVRRSSKVWRVTEHGTPFLPISKEGEYVFIVGTSVFEYRNKFHMHSGEVRKHALRLHKDLPDLEMALTIAEDEATDRGGDIGKLLADRNRPWRKAVPSTEMQEYAQRLGLGKELAAIMGSRAGSKAGKLSDLISKVQATRALEPMVEKIKEMTP